MSTEARASSVGRHEVKICEFCGTLNHYRNTECFICGWRGAFSRDDTALRYAWSRLMYDFGAVGREQVCAQAGIALGDDGKLKRPQGLAAMAYCVNAWWRRAIGRRSPSAGPSNVPAARRPESV